MHFIFSHQRRAFIAGFVAFVLLSVSVGSIFAQGGPNFNPTAAPQAIPTNQWVVKIAAGSDVSAVAQMAGMVNLGPVANMPGYYLFEAPAMTAAAPAPDSIAAQSISQGLRGAPGVLFTEQQIIYPRASRVITDPLYGNQWHLNNTGQSGGTVGEDANVVAAWNAGYDGTGVIVAINDDGVDYTHPDIADHWRAADSYDYWDDDADVLHGAHGTAVAGVAAASDNAACGVGVAYNADIAGIVTGFGAAEASSLAHKLDVIHLMNNSWGPWDDGIEWGGVSQTSLDAVELGVTTGRGGLGTIYVWAGGNGGNNDNTGADSFVNSRYTIGVAASTNTGTRSSYSERGSALLVNAPSNGGSAGITTTDIMGSAGYSSGDCTSTFGGTSSASPLVAGVVALMLDANPNLTWRDVQAILLQTAEKNHPASADWQTNGAGYHVHPAYGFGRVDAGAAVAAAATWMNLPQEVNFSSGVISADSVIPSASYGEFTFNLTEPITVESVEVVLNATHPYRGELQIEIQSPEGTRSIMLYPRSKDNGDNINNYTLLSTHQWGESAVGTWKLLIKDINAAANNGTLNNWELKINGTASLSTDAVVTANETAPAGGATTVSVADSDLIGNGYIEISATSDAGESETITLYETDIPGVFEQTFTLVDAIPTVSNATLEGQTGDTLTFTYVDAVNSGGAPADRTASTLIVAPTYELLQNGGFEAYTERQPDQWTASDGTRARVKCNTDTRSFAFEGDCAYMIRAQLYKQVLKQNINSDVTSTINVGDSLVFSAHFNTRNVTALTIARMVVIYSETNPETGKPYRDKITYKPTAGTSDGYYTMTAAPIITSRAVERIRVILQYRGEAGKVFFDGLSVGHTPGGAALKMPRIGVEDTNIIPLPDAPEGFRR